MTLQRVQRGPRAQAHGSGRKFALVSLLKRGRKPVAVPGRGAASGAAAALASDRDGTTAITDCIESAMGHAIVRDERDRPRAADSEVGRNRL